MKHLSLALVVGVSSLALACQEEVALSQHAAPRGPTRVASADEVVSMVLPPDLISHRLQGAVQGVSGDGAYRVHVERLRPERLIRLAASAKDGWTARGWEVTGEQHLERALFAAMRRGGVPRNPRERREVWWVEGDRAVTLCDVIVQRTAFDRLGDPVRAGCETIEVVSWPPEDE